MIPAELLVIEDDAVLRRALRRAIRGRTRLRCVEAESSTTAKQVLCRSDLKLRGAIVDVGLPGGESGLGLLERIRERAPDARILVFTGRRGDDVVTACREYGTEVAFKPVDERCVLRFIEDLWQRVLASESACLPILERAVEVFASRHLLPFKQRRIVELMATGTRRAHLAEALEVEESTVRTHIRALLTTTGARSVDELGWQLLGLVSTLETPKAT